MNARNLFAGFLLVSLLCPFATPGQAKEHKTAGSNIEITATPQVVFEAIRKQRNVETPDQTRTLASFDGKVAVIDEKMHHVPIYGNVDCTFQETEFPYKRIDYKMLKSTKFKESFGSWILTPSADGKHTTLEFDSFTDSGLMIPFGGEITKMESMKTSKLRLAHIKEVAEKMMKEPGSNLSDKASDKGSEKPSEKPSDKQKKEP